VQEEPENMGAWSFILKAFLQDDILAKLEVAVISRKESGSPATGSAKQHVTQQQYILNKSFDLIPEAPKGRKLVKQS
jgi:2-oxoglutarate dehydrogenase E1 component